MINEKRPRLAGGQLRAGPGVPHGDKVDEGLDKAGDFIDEKTCARYGDKIDQGIDPTKVEPRKLDAQAGDLIDDQSSRTPEPR